MPETRNSGSVTIQNIAPTTAVPKGYRFDSATAVARGFADMTGGIPAGAAYAIIQVRGGIALWRDDGVNPVNTNGGGMLLGYDPAILGTPTVLIYDGDFTAFKYILAVGTPLLDVAFYG